MNLTRLEAQLVTLAKQRYEKWYCRHTWVFAWLFLLCFIAMFGVLLVPGWRWHANWLGGLATLLLFLWWALLNQRLIGKLVTARHETDG